MSKALAASAILALPLLVFVGFGALLGRLAGKTRPPGRMAINTHLHYGVEEVESYWRWHRERAAPPSLLARTAPGTGLDAERRFLKLDLIFALLYPGALALSLAWIWRALSQPFPAAWFVVPLLLVTLCDWTENAIQLGQMPRFLAGRPLEPGWIALASLATAVKVVGTIGAYLALAGLVVRFLRAAPAPG